MSMLIRIYIYIPFGMQIERNIIFKSVLPDIRVKIEKEPGMIFRVIDLSSDISALDKISDEQGKDILSYFICVLGSDSSLYELPHVISDIDWDRYIIRSESMDKNDKAIIKRSYNLKGDRYYLKKWLWSTTKDKLFSFMQRAFIDKKLNDIEQSLLSILNPDRTYNTFFYFKKEVQTDNADSSDFIIDDIKERIKKAGNYSIFREYDPILEISDHSLTDDKFKFYNMLYYNLSHHIYDSQKFRSFQKKDRTDRAYHEGVMEQYVHNFHGREKYLKEINNFVHKAFNKGDNKKHLFIVGRAGIGKSSLLSKFCFDYIKSNPKDLVIPYFISPYGESADLQDILRYLCRYLSEELQNDAKIPNDLRDIEDHFWSLLKEFKKRERKVLFVIDDITSIPEGDTVRFLESISEIVFDNICFILSADGDIQDKAGFEYLIPKSLYHFLRMFIFHAEALFPDGTYYFIIGLEKLSEEDKEKFIKGYFDSYQIIYNEHIITGICNKRDSNLPIYLRLIFNNLITMTSYHEISDFIQRDLPDDLSGMFELILNTKRERIKYISGENAGNYLFYGFLYLLSACRNGMRETDVRFMLGRSNSLRSFLNILDQIF